MRSIKKQLLTFGIATAYCFIPLSQSQAGWKDSLSSFVSSPETKDNETTQTTAGIIGVHVEAHDYEGALKPEDKRCETMVDPFPPFTGKISEVIKGNSADSAKRMFSGMLSGGNAKQELLKQARINAKRINWLTMEAELKYGATLHQSLKENPEEHFIENADSPIHGENYKKLERALKNVTAQIPDKHDYNFKAFLLDKDTVEAAANPGGYIYVSSGALESNHAELVISHEIAHILKRHRTRELQAKLIDSVETIQDLESLIKNKGSDGAKLLTAIKLASSSIYFSKQQEIQADACAIRLTSKVPNVNVSQQIIGFGETLKAAEKNKQRFSTTHPPYARRQEEMKKVAALVK